MYSNYSYCGGNFYCVGEYFGGRFKQGLKLYLENVGKLSCRIYGVLGSIIIYTF